VNDEGLDFAIAPATPAFSMRRVVEDGDIDELGHASNIAYVRWIQDVAVEHSKAVGLDTRAYMDLGAVFVVRRHEIDYLRPAFRGDELEVRTWLSTTMAAKAMRATEIVRVADGAILARGMTIWGFVDTAAGRPTRIPNMVRSAFGQALRGARRDAG
jgi:acyl-CoA thioester hydrolase